MFFLLTEFYWSVDEIMSLLESVRQLFEEVSNYFISIISPIRFHLNHWEYGKCNNSSEEHLRKKTSIVAFLDLQLFIFVKKKLKSIS
jgi:hypothetical protein